MSKAPTSPSFPNAGLIKRLLAMIYDGLLLLAISMGYAGIVLAIKINMLGLDLAPGEKAQMGPVGFIGWIIVLIGFYCYFWQRFGQTLGMKAWRLELVNQNGQQVNLRQCITRCLFAICSFVFLGIGYWWIFFDPLKITLHDRLSRTRILQLPKS